MNANDVIDDMLIVQKNWIYLESIFSSPDINARLPAESKEFLNVNKFFTG